MATTRDTLRLVDTLRRQLDGVVDEQARDITRAFAELWDEVAGELTTTLAELLVTPGERITRSQMLRSQRLLRALAAIRVRLEQLADEAGVRITGDMATIVATAGAAQASVIDSQLPPGSGLVDTAGWDRVDVRQIEAIVNRATERIVSRLDPLPDDVMAVVRRELIRGVTVGANPRTTAARMVKRVEGHVNGRWGRSRALSIARSEMLDASREAARVSRLQQEDVLAGWVWGCRLDVRSCPSCFARHGTLYPIEVRGPDDHPQGRCVAVPRTKPWSELGFTMDEPEDLLPDAEAVFGALPEADQVAIMGRTRLDLLRSGAVAWSDLATLRRNPDWRDSWQMTPLKTLARRVAA